MAKSRSSSPKVLMIPFPLRGKDTNWARVDQPPLTTPDCLNVWAYDRFNRSRGAQRPGFTRMWAESVDNDVLYYQCYRCTDDTLQDLYVKASEIGGFPYRFKWAGDYQCYHVLASSPKTFAPGIVAYSGSRTTVTLCSDVTCGQEYNPPAYRRARNCSDGELANLWVPAAEISSYPYYFKFAGDDRCYQVLNTDATTVAPGLIAATATRTSKLSCSASGCTCTGCLVTPTDFAWDTGTVYELGFVGGAANFIRNSGEFHLCSLGGEDSVRFDGISDDIVVLTKSTDAVTQSHSGVAGDPVTITLPANYILFRDTFGSLRNAAEGSNPETCEKTIDDGTYTGTIPPGGDSPSSDHDHVVDLEADGFTTRSWGENIDFTDLDALGFIDADGIARLRFWHIVSGAGRARVTAVNCVTGSTGVTLYNTGEESTAGGDCPSDDHWTVNGLPAQVVEEDAWVSEPADSEWISGRCDKRHMADLETEPDFVYEYETVIVIGTDVTLADLEIPFQLAADQSLEEVYINGVAQGITRGADAFGSLSSHTLDDDFVAGNNTIKFVVNGGPYGSGYSGDLQGLLVKWGTPTW